MDPLFRGSVVALEGFQIWGGGEVSCPLVWSPQSSLGCWLHSLNGYNHEQDQSLDQIQETRLRENS